MQENDIRITLKTLFTFGKIDAIKDIRDTLKRDYEYACDLLGIEPENSTVDVAVKSSSTNTSQKKNDKPILYRKDWSYKEKFVHVLKNQQKFIKFREAAEIIVEIEGGGDVDLITRRLTASTNKLKRQGKIVKVSVGGHANTFWGLSKWLDDDGNIESGYEFSEDSITTKSSSNKSKSGILDDL